MDNSTNVSLSLATALQRELDVTANNIANANTVGFRSERVLFESLLTDDGHPEIGGGTSFVLDRGSYLDETQGGITRTDNPLDVALKGNGWLSYQTPGGQVAFGRDGRFNLDSEGNLVTLDGSPVLDQSSAPISLPSDIAGAITISPDGTISADGVGVLGQIGIFDLPDIQSFNRIGNGMLVRPAGSRAVAVLAGDTELVQGAVENSNVQPVVEVTRLMTIQQAYERSIKIMSTADDLQRDMLRRIGQQG